MKSFIQMYSRVLKSFREHSLWAVLKNSFREQLQKLLSLNSFRETFSSLVSKSARETRERRTPMKGARNYKI